MLQEILKQQKATIIDVRTAAEFTLGHVNGSKNIPLQEIPERVEEIQQLTQPLVLCCAAGVRSEHACQYLKQLGLDCYNGGSWQQVNAML